MQSIKCVVTGDTRVGKTCLVQTYDTNEYPQNYYPNSYSGFSKKFAIDGKEINLEITDAIGQIDYVRLRKYGYYPKTNVFIICFSIDSPTSLANVESEWLPEVRRIRPSTPIILLGTMLDLRHENGKLQDGSIKIEEGEEMAKKIGAVKYLECSALNKEGLNEIFEAAAHVGSEHKKASKGFFNSIVNFFRK